MPIETFTLTPTGPYTVRIDWTADSADTEAWVYVNGLLAHGPLAFDGTARNAEVNLKSGEVACIEIQEIAAGGDPSAVDEEPNTRPTIRWLAVSDEDLRRYNLNHREYGGTNAVLQRVEPVDDQDDYSRRVQVPLSDDNTRWHEFEVTAEDEYGNESTVKWWLYEVFDLPEPVSAITVSGSASNLTITLTE